MSEKAYKIFVGDPRPGDALIGHLQPGQGNSILKGTTTPAPPIGGKAMFANRSICWGRRLIKGKVVEGRKVQPTDPEYTGEIEWMKWGAEGGTQINVRFKRGCSSVDYDYQVTQLMLPKYSEDLEDSYLDFPFGENNIFYDSEPVKAEFLRITHSNEDSIYKSPDSTGAVFHEVKIFDTSKKEVKELDEWFEAVKLIKEANTFQKLTVIKNIVGKKREIKVDESDENSLYETMMLHAKNNGPEFMGYINEYKRKISDLFERFKSYNAFDLTKNGVIKAGIERKDELLTDIPAKGEMMLDWMFQNCLKPEVHEAVDKMIHISQKFK